MAINDSAMSVTWNPPANMTVVSYQVIVKKYIHKDGSNQVTTRELNPPYRVNINNGQSFSVQVAKGLGK